MSNFVESTKSAIQTGLCNYLSFAGKGESWFNELSPVDLPSTGQFWDRVLCDRNDGLPPTPPPFDGGQCPGALYRFFATRTRFDFEPSCDPQVTNPQLLAVGPVSGPFFREFDVPQPDRVGQEWFMIDGNGNEMTFGTSSRDEACSSSTLTIDSVVREDGQPDDCGNQTPAPAPFPTGGETTPINITYVNNEGDNVTELGDLRIFAPVVIAPVNIIAPIRVELPDLVFDGTIQLAPEFSIGLNPPTIDDSPGDVDAPPPPEDPSTSPDTPSDESNAELIGAVVTVSDADESLATQIFGGQGPDVFAPRLGTLAFRVRVAGATAWFGNYPVQNSTQFFPAPRGAIAVDARFSPIAYVQGTVSLVYRTSQPDP